MRIFKRNENANPNAEIQTAIYDVNGTATVLYADGVRFTGRWNYTIDEISNSSYWTEQILEPKPRPLDEDAFPLVMDGCGRVWRANPVGGYASGSQGVPDLDTLDAERGPLTMIGAV